MLVSHQFADSLLENFPELDSVSVVYQWRYKADNLPVGVVIPRPTGGTDTLLDAMRQTTNFLHKLINIWEQELARKTQRALPQKKQDTSVSSGGEDAQ